MSGNSRSRRRPILAAWLVAMAACLWIVAHTDFTAASPRRMSSGSNGMGGVCHRVRQTTPSPSSRAMRALTVRAARFIAVSLRALR